MESKASMAGENLRVLLQAFLSKMTNPRLEEKCGLASLI